MTGVSPTASLWEEDIHRINVVNDIDDITAGEMCLLRIGRQEYNHYNP